MKEVAFHKTVGVLFLIVGVLHLLRAVMTWPLKIDNYMIGVWFSYIAAIVILWLSYESFKLTKGKVKKKRS